MSSVNPTAQSRATEPAREVRLSSVFGGLVRTLVFEILAALGSAYGAFAMIGVIYSVLSQDNFHGATLYFAYLSNGTLILVLAASSAISVAVAGRVLRMLRAANDGDVAGLRKLSSPGWAIAAIFGSYVLPGVWLLRIHRTIRTLDGIAG
jgi:hypothetical protein